MMATPKDVKNLQALNKQAFQQKFDLDGTDYEPIENIGSGAYGIVCSAVHRKTKEQVAIKKIASIVDNYEIMKRTYREIRILRHFKHDNIISIREILKPKTADFKDIQIVLDFMESDLHKIIHSQELTDEHVRYFLYQILRGLKYIHSANVIHRDLKPSNLLVNANCELKIGDFGMARGVSVNPRMRNSSMTQYVATRWYRAPELIISDEEYSFAVDLWSVGCILAEMLGRKVLFRGENHIQQFTLIIQKCGTPSQTFLEKYAVPYIQMLSNTQCKAVEWSKEYPKAHRKAISMLSKLVLVDPRDRSTAEEALKHPYLSKYHEPNDEPICIPAFNFDFEEKVNTREELRKFITEEIMSYHQAPKLNCFDLKPVPKDQLKQLVHKKQGWDGAVPQLSPRTTGLESFLQLQKSLQADDRSFKKPFPAVTVGSSDTVGPTSSNDVEMLSARSLKSEDGKLNVMTTSLPANDVEMLSARTNIKTEPLLEGNDNKATPLTEQKETSTTQQQSSQSTQVLTSLATKLKIKEAIMKGQIKPHIVTELRPKPKTAYMVQKEKERKKKEKLEKAKRKKSRLKGQEQKSESEMSEMDKSILARWESMQKSKPENPNKENKPVDGGTTNEGQGNVTVSATTQGTMQSAALPASSIVASSSVVGNTTLISNNVISGNNVQAPFMVNLSGQIFPQNLNLSQNMYIPYTPNIPIASTMQGGSNINNTLIYTLPQVTGFPVNAAGSIPQLTTPLTTSQLGYTLPTQQQTYVVIGDTASSQAESQPATLQTRSKDSTVTIAGLPQQLPLQVSSQRNVPFATYQATNGVESYAGSLPGHKQSYISQAGSTDQTVYTGLTEHSKDTGYGQVTSTQEQTYISQGTEPPATTTQAAAAELSKLTEYQRRSWGEFEDSYTPPARDTPSNTPEHHTDYKDISIPVAEAPAAADMEQEMKKMKINSHLQPAMPILVHTPRGTGVGYGVGLEGDNALPDPRSNDIDSGTSESALASGLKRDWQQAINMDPKELEEALKTVLMDDLPSPRFVSDLMDPKH